MKKIIRKIPAGIVSGLLTILVLYASLAADPMGINEIPLFAGADKIIHFIMYFALAGAYYLDYSKLVMPHHTKLNMELAVLSAAIVLGGVLEVLQEIQGKGRHMDIGDLLADALGAIAVFIFIKYYFMKRFRVYILGKRHHHNNVPHHHNTED